MNIVVKTTFASPSNLYLLCLQQISYLWICLFAVTSWITVWPDMCCNCLLAVLLISFTFPVKMPLHLLITHIKRLHWKWTHAMCNSSHNCTCVQNLQHYFSCILLFSPPKRAGTIMFWSQTLNTITEWMKKRIS